MSISTQRRLDELKAEALANGIVVKPSGSKESKTDYVYALRDFYLNQKYGVDNIPQGLKLMLEIDGPMLAAQTKHLSQKEMEELWKDGNDYIAQQKIDGCRLVSFWSPNPEECDKFSRNISVKDFCPVSYQDNIYTPNLDYSKITHRFLLDSELTAPASISTVMGKKGVVTECQLQSVTALLAMEPTESIRIQRDELTEDGVAPLKFNAFDLLWIDGEWIMDKPYIERYKLTLMVAKELKAAGLNICIPASTANNKKAFYKKIVAAGGEGVILKNVRCSYVAGANRSKVAMLKVKRTTSETMGDNVDGWISGYKLGTPGTANENLVSALEISTNLIMADGTTKTHVVANVPGLSLEQKQNMTEIGEDGTPRLKAEYYGKVVEVEGQNFSARAWALQHPVLLCWRPDKGPEGCQITEEMIRAQIM